MNKKLFGLLGGFLTIKYVIHRSKAKKVNTGIPSLKLTRDILMVIFLARSLNIELMEKTYENSNAAKTLGHKVLQSREPHLTNH